jgi:putative protease
MLNKKLKKIELLAPAGSPEKMKYAFAYGADAVYAGVPDFSMRRRINSFDEKSLLEGIKYAHKLGKKFYVTLNIYAHNVHIEKIEKHLNFLKKAKPDAVIVSDPGILSLVKKNIPEMEIHLSTQANATNWQAVKFWHGLGIKRIVLAREVTLPEIREIKKRVPEAELEYFVHGAMCMSYSGRCLLSKWMTNRSANLGDCVQPCRWLYKVKNKKEKVYPVKSAKGGPASQEFNGVKSDILLMNVKDEKEEFEINLEEDNHGTYFFNSKDLNLLDYLQELKNAGVDSFKIEGRNKSVYYLSVVLRAYRKVLDAIENPVKSAKGGSATQKFNRVHPVKSAIGGAKQFNRVNKIIKEQQKELKNLFHRGYTTGFLLEKEPEHNFADSHKKATHQFVGEIVGQEKRLLKIKPHNAIYLKDKLEIITPEKNIPIKIKNILDENGKEKKSAHGGQVGFYYVEIVDKLKANKFEKFFLIRKKIK